MFRSRTKFEDSIQIDGITIASRLAFRFLNRQGGDCAEQDANGVWHFRTWLDDGSMIEFYDNDEDYQKFMKLNKEDLYFFIYCAYNRSRLLGISFHGSMDAHYHAMKFTKRFFKAS